MKIKTWKVYQTKSGKWRLMFPWGAATMPTRKAARELARIMKANS